MRTPFRRQGAALLETPATPLRIFDETASSRCYGVAKVEALDNFKLNVTFLDGLAGAVDLSELSIQHLPACFQCCPIMCALPAFIPLWVW